MSYSFTSPVKDPDAVLDYPVDWTAWLASGETITDQSVTSDSEALTISNVVEADGIVRFRAAGGVDGTDYNVTVEITTSTGQVDNRTIRLRVRER